MYRRAYVSEYWCLIVLVLVRLQSTPYCDPFAAVLCEPGAARSEPAVLCGIFAAWLLELRQVIAAGDGGTVEQRRCVAALALDCLFRFAAGAVHSGSAAQHSQRDHRFLQHRLLGARVARVSDDRLQQHRLRKARVAPEYDKLQLSISVLLHAVVLLFDGGRNSEDKK